MFALFYSLYMAMFVGTWNNYTIPNINTNIQSPLMKLITMLTSMFNNVSTPMENTYFTTNEMLALSAFILALITSIGIVVMAVKGVKRAFGIFFMGIRR